MREGVQKGRNPFRIEGPALISFSGGRTSAYMLRRILDEGLQSDVHIVFADTGKELQETYDFVNECERRWAVRVYWVKRPGGFERLIREKQALPHVRARWCTQHLKVYPIRELAMGVFGWEDWTGAIGIRADEPRRLAKMRSKPNDMPGEDRVFPLAEAGITLAEVMAFWRAQPFDLQLQPWEGNCDLCFLKAQYKRVAIMRDRPELAAWWIEKEQQTGHTFRARPRPSYSELLQIAQHPELPFGEEEDLSDCICGD